MKGYMRLIGVMLMLLLFDAGCASEEPGEGSLQADARVYGIEKEFSLGLSEEALWGCFVTDTAVYYTERKKGADCLMMRELTAQAKPAQLFSLEENEALDAFAVTETGEAVSGGKEMRQRLLPGT